MAAFKVCGAADTSRNHRRKRQNGQDERLLLSDFAKPMSENREPMCDRDAHLACYWLHPPIPEPMGLAVQAREPGLCERISVQTE